MKSRPAPAIVLFTIVCALFASVTTTPATTLEQMNMERLVQLGELILVGSVIDLTDGFDGAGLPYTEVTLQVGEAVRGSVGGTYSFRQFGLLAPRDMGDGRTYLGVSPPGWPKFKVGEEVMVFLHAKTSLGFQSTVGLLQGKFNITESQIFNQIDNSGLFDNLSVDPGALTEGEQKLLQMSRGRCPVEPFKSLVRKAVEHDWFE